VSVKAQAYKAGEKIDITAGSDITAGTPQSVCGLCGIPPNDIDSGASDALQIEGIVKVQKVNEAWTAGDTIWYDNDGDPYNGTAGTGAATKTVANGDILMGIATADADATDEHGYVLLNRFENADILEESGDISLLDGVYVKFGTGNDVTLNFDGTSMEIESAAASTPLLIGADAKLLNTTLKGTFTVGKDDTGHDVKFFGATASKYWMWDESADKMIVVGDSQFTGTVTVGVDDTGHDVKFFGATTGKYMLWDESADQLVILGTADLGTSCEADAYTVGGVAGADFGPAAPASLTVVKGIVTAASS